MKIPTRPSLVALLATTGVALAGCPEKPPQPRTSRAATAEQVGPAVANVTAAVELAVPPSPRNS